MFCSECGQQLRDGAKFCVACGVGLDGTAPSVAAAPAVAVPTDEALHAGFWRRYVAALIDAVLLAILCAAPLAYDLTITQSAASYITTPMLIASPLLGLLYLLLSEGLMQATPGKWISGLKVTDSDGEKIGLGRAALRLLGRLLTMVTLGIGFVVAGFTENCRALTDMVAGTLVVSRQARPTAIARAPNQAMRASPAIVAGAVLLTPVGLGLLLLALIGLPHLLFDIPSAPDGIRQQIRSFYEFTGANQVEVGPVEESETSVGGSADGDLAPTR